jgi:hypothetical protein
MNPAAACFEEKQSANSVFAARRARCPGRLSLGNIVHHPFLKLPEPNISENLGFSLVYPQTGVRHGVLSRRT